MAKPCRAHRRSPRENGLVRATCLGCRVRDRVHGTVQSKSGLDIYIYLYIYFRTTSTNTCSILLNRNDTGQKQREVPRLRSCRIDGRAGWNVCATQCAPVQARPSPTNAQACYASEQPAQMSSLQLACCELLERVGAEWTQLCMSDGR